MKEYKRKFTKVTAVIFPDNGPDQGQVSRWVKENGGEMGLYDGCVQNNVKTSTNAVWRWATGSLKVNGNPTTVRIGDYIVNDNGDFNVYSPEKFKEKFESH